MTCGTSCSGGPRRQRRPGARRGTRPARRAPTDARPPRKRAGFWTTRARARRLRSVPKRETTCATSIRGCRGPGKRAGKTRRLRATPRPRIGRSNHAWEPRERKPLRRRPHARKLRAPKRRRFRLRGSKLRGYKPHVRKPHRPKRPGRRRRAPRRRELRPRAHKPRPRPRPSAVATIDAKQIGRLPLPLTRKSSRAGGVGPPARPISSRPRRPGACRGCLRTPRCSTPR